ncbi:MAG: SUMF1/EgtB/PvdO family nonheme iron enzyme [Chloroflexi bacterium]|nr:SUMF1/EgtB/PvdO family nonheme iron enzyme [Chloroflexota bacterium]
MSDWREVINKLAEGIRNEPILAFVAFIVVVLALVGPLIPSSFLPLIYIIVGGVVLVYIAARWLGLKREPSARSIEKEPTPNPILTPQSSTVTFASSTSFSPDARKEYLDALITDFQPARLVGRDPTRADPSRGVPLLEQLYVSLDTTTNVEIKEEKKKQRQRAEPAEFLREKTRPLTALEALTQSKDRRVVLLGLPGSGKSTFVRYLALRHAEALRDASLDMQKLLPGWHGQAVMPLVVPLGRLAESFPSATRNGNARLVEQFVRANLESDERTRPFAASVLDVLHQAGGLVLFDGLDEVADLNRRPLVVQAIQDFVQQYGKNSATRFLATCRKFSYNDARWKFAGWETHELAPFTPQKISEFVKAWYDEHQRLDPARRDDYENKRASLSNALQSGDRRGLAKIADNPLILTVMSVVHTHYGKLPDTRAEVYERCIDLLLLRWEMIRTIGGQKRQRTLLDDLNVERKRLYDALFEIAYEAHAGRDSQNKEQQARVTHKLLTGVLNDHFQDPGKVQTFLDYCDGANGLLMFQGEEKLADDPSDAPRRRFYAFPHLTFEEYLAARRLKGGNIGQRVRELVDANYDRWREVVMLLGEQLCFLDDDSERMNFILEKLAPIQPAQNEKDWRARWMAGDLLTLYQRRFKDPSPHAARLAQDLVRLIESNALAPVERAAAANALAELGDPRAGVSVKDGLPDLVWCTIPDGDFTMGDNEEYGGGKSFEYNIQKPFYIARYPITNEQFDAFENDPDGYKKDDWWTREGSKWRGNRERHEKYGGVFDLPNHPVVNVTWYEAVAFARWLDEKLKGKNVKFNVWQTDHVEPLQLPTSNLQLEIRLPSEAEWEKAASWDDEKKIKRRYPWGDDPDPNRANYGDTQIGATSAVGSFPNGKSPYHVLDMSGNVWEWCMTRWVDDYKNYSTNENNNPEGDESRVIRGGAFNNVLQNVRGAYRLRRDPDNRLGYRGFRVVLASV